MKKIRTISLLLVLCMVLLLAGCGTASEDVSEAAPEKTPEEMVTATISEMMDSMMQVDTDSAKKYFAEELQDESFFHSFYDTEDLDDIYAAMGMTEEEGFTPDMLSEEAQESVRNFAEAYNNRLFEGYEVTDVTVDGVEATAKMTVDLGVDAAAINSLNPEDIVSEEEQEAALNECKADVDALLAEGKESEAKAIFYSKYLQLLMKAMTEYLENADGTSAVWDLTLSEVDDDWVITKMVKE